jgi:RNA polymerase-interacting CarD/CdnL/TRCF family regulator
MILTVGSTVVYPCQGPCLVGAAVERLVAGEPRSFYHLVALYDSGGELFVPVDKVRAIGIRLLSQRSDIPKLQGQGHLMETTKVAKDWKQGANDILKTVHLRIGV